VSAPHFLLTNDDGIDAPGLRAMHRALSEVGDVTVLAPIEEQSALGRALAYERTVEEPENELDDEFAFKVPYEEHELGYAVIGTACDCAIVGADGFDVDMVVAGCNPGTNLGLHALGRSSTVGAVIEAALLDMPAMAVSAAVPDGLDPTVETFDEAALLAADLAVYALESEVFDAVDYLNLNVPEQPSDCGIALTEPDEAYRMEGAVHGDEFHLYDHVSKRMAADDLSPPSGSDRRGIVEGKCSLSPLSVPYEPADASVLEEYVASR
jgi:5'-nucleotidase